MDALPDRPLLLKVLLRERHWQHYGTFCAEYDKAARQIDQRLVGSWPSRAQLHRWQSGDLKALPYPDHCRVLERMFPGYTAKALFSPCPDGLSPVSRQPRLPINDGAQLHQPAAGGTGRHTVVPVVSVRRYVERAFARDEVRIDFSGFSGETLHGAVQEPLDRIRTGQLRPTSVRIRLLLLNTSRPWSVPCRTGDLADDPGFRQRAHRIMVRHAQAVLDTVEELSSLGLVGEASAEIRVHDCPPSFKVYIFNEDDLLFGFYPITEHMVTIDGGTRSMYDLMGKDTMLFHHARDGSPVSAAFVEQARAWFDSVWQTISHEYTG